MFLIREHELTVSFEQTENFQCNPPHKGRFRPEIPVAVPAEGSLIHSLSCAYHCHHLGNHFTAVAQFGQPQVGISPQGDLLTSNMADPVGYLSLLT